MRILTQKGQKSSSGPRSQSSAPPPPEGKRIRLVKSKKQLSRGGSPVSTKRKKAQILLLPPLTETSNTGSLGTGRPHFNSEQHTRRARQRWREGCSKAGQGMEATTRTPTSETKTQLCLVTHLRGWSAAKGQTLCTLLLVWLGKRQWGGMGWGGTPVEGAACFEPPQSRSVEQLAAASYNDY